LMVEKKYFSNMGLKPWRPKNLRFELALKTF
jgi:hypothetical protein